MYIPTDGMTGVDTFSYQLIHNGMISAAATVQLSVFGIPTGQPSGRPSSFNKNPIARYPTGQPSRQPTLRPSASQQQVT